MIPFRALMQPHRIVMLALLLAVVIWCAVALRWDWIPEYAPLALEGLWRTIWILVVTCVLGFLLAIPLGLAQAIGYKEFLPYFEAEGCEDNATFHPDKREEQEAELAAKNTESTLAACVVRLKVHHRQYAKRQATWIRRRVLGRGGFATAGEDGVVRVWEVGDGLGDTASSDGNDGADAGDDDGAGGFVGFGGRFRGVRLVDNGALLPPDGGGGGATLECCLALPAGVLCAGD